MQVVGHLVRLDPDEPGRDDVDGAVHLVEIEAANGIAEVRLQPGMAPRPECAGAADLVLPETALAFVDAKRHRAPHRRSDVLRAEPLLVHAVARLVHGRAEGVVDVPLREAGREPDVVAVGPAAERMRGRVEPSAAVVEPDRFRHEADERHLPVDGQRQLVEGVGGPSPAVRQLADEGPEPGAERVEHGRDVAGRASRLVVLGQGIPRLAGLVPRAPSVALGLPAQEADDPLQRRTELLEIVVAPRFRPDVAAEARQLRLLPDEVRREPRPPVVVAAELAHVDRGRRERLAEQLTIRLADAEKLTHPRVGHHLVAQAGELADLAGAKGDAPCGHQNLLVPSQELRRGAQQVGVAGDRDQVGVRGGGRRGRR